MPTIDQLDPVIVSSDDDQLPVSQAGALRRVTRARLLSGMQPTLSLSPGLLGRSTQGTGGPEHIGVGNGLTLKDGILASTPPFTIASLTTTDSVIPTDQVAVSRAGQDRSVCVSSLVSVGGLDVSRQLVCGTSGSARSLKDWASDAMPLEAFGAIGDGITDDSAAFLRAASSGRSVRLGEKVYRVDGQCSIDTPFVLIGTPGLSSLRRTRQSGGAWIEIDSNHFTAYGITFDAGETAVDSWGVLVGPNCTELLIDTCVFGNTAGASLGSGLVIQARDGLAGDLVSRTVQNCCFRNNKVHGLWVQAAAGIVVENCVAYQNGQYGLCLDYNDALFSQQVRQSVIMGCRSWGNSRGISVGNFNETNLEPPRWGLLNPDAIDVLVSGNVCSGNSAYAIGASGERLRIIANQMNVSPNTSGASGLLLNACHSVVSDNTITGSGVYGIDAGGCRDCRIEDNDVDGFDVGINAGGGQNISVRHNRLRANIRGVTVFQVETDGQGSNFGLACSDVDIFSNEIELRDCNGAGVVLVDGPQNVVICQNLFLPGIGSHPAQAIQANTDSVVVMGNRWDGRDIFVAAPTTTGGVLVCPEVFDRVAVVNTPTGVGTITGEYQASLMDGISFVRVLTGGSGYRSAQVTIVGSGLGASATAYIRDGAIIGVAMLAAGGGYGQIVPQVIVSGDGEGASAEAFVGLPLPEGRRLELRCDASVRFWTGNKRGQLSNWTGADITVPQGTEIVWVAQSDLWHGVAFALTDYVRPTGTGAVRIGSARGDLTLEPGEGGQLRVSSSSEPVGYVTLLGRGSPEGVVAASPGSDYRNLDGGQGSTFWVKCLGSESVGWTAIA